MSDTIMEFYQRLLKDRDDLNELIKLCEKKLHDRNLTISIECYAGGGGGGGEVGMLTGERGMSGIKGTDGPQAPEKPSTGRLRKKRQPVSIHSAAHDILQKVPAGLTEAELVVLLQKRGVAIGGSNPNSALHSILYRKPKMFMRKDKRWVSR